MSGSTSQQARVKRGFSAPWWGWLFGAACVAIPVVSLGGAIPGALGCGAAGLCVTLSGQKEVPTRTRVLQCGAVTLGAWVLFLALVKLVQGSSPKLNVTTRSRDSSGTVTVTRRSERPPTDLTDEQIRREIYTKATRLRETRKRESERVDPNTEFGRKHLGNIDKAQEKQLEFIMKFHRLSRSQLDEVIREGDQKNWP